MRRDTPSLLRREHAEDTLVVSAAEPARRFAFELVQARLRAELALAAAPGGTLAELAVEGPFLLAFSRSLPKAALGRLHDLCQTAATL